MTWLDSVYGAEAALWLTDAPALSVPQARAGIRWTRRQVVLAAWHVGAGVVGTFLLGGMVAAVLR
jgi:hypothetical protein